MGLAIRAEPSPRFFVLFLVLFLGFSFRFVVFRSFRVALFFVVAVALRDATPRILLLLFTA